MIPEFGARAEMSADAFPALVLFLAKIGLELRSAITKVKRRSSAAKTYAKLQNKLGGVCKELNAVLGRAILDSAPRTVDATLHLLRAIFFSPVDASGSENAPEHVGTGPAVVIYYPDMLADVSSCGMLGREDCYVDFIFNMFDVSIIIVVSCWCSFVPLLEGKITVLLS